LSVTSRGMKKLYYDKLHLTAHHFGVRRLDATLKVESQFSIHGKKESGVKPPHSK